MNGDKNKALKSLIKLSQKKGYLLLDDIMSVARKYDLSDQEVDNLSGNVMDQGIVYYSDKPPLDKTCNTSDYDDFSQTDYEAIFDKVISLSPTLKPFIDDIRKIIPPQHREASQLKDHVLEKNQDARRRMIEMYLRLAVKIALNRVEAFDLDIEETLGDACVGLIKAVDNYKSDTVNYFGSYASYRIFQNIVREQGTCRPLVDYPAYMKDIFCKTYLVLKKYCCIDCPRLSRCKKVKLMVSDEMKCPEKNVDDIIAACIPVEEFLKDQNLSREQSMRWVKADDIIIEKNLKDDINHLLMTLKDKERNILTLRFGLNEEEPLTLEDIAKKYNVTRERIRQIEKKTLIKLRENKEAENLKDYIL